MSHAKQEASLKTPTSSEYLPMPHFLQASMDVAASVEDQVPLPQFLQLESFMFPNSSEYLPATHALHITSFDVRFGTPSTSEYRPAIQL